MLCLCDLILAKFIAVGTLLGSMNQGAESSRTLIRVT